MKNQFKYLLLLVVFSSGCYIGNAQKSATALTILTRKLADANDGILILKSNTRTTVTNQKVSYQNGLVQISYTINRENYYAQFQAENILQVSNFSDALCASNSPVGVIRLYFENHLVKIWNDGKYGDPKYEDYFDFYFLRKDTDAFDMIEDNMSELQPINTRSYRDTTLDHLYNKHVNNEFWVKDKNISTTYYLDDVVYSDNLLYLYYRKVEESLKSTRKDILLAVLPLSSMEKIFLDSENSKPAGVFLDADIKGLEVYTYISSLDYYSIIKNKEETLCLFLKIATPGDKQHLQDYLNRTIRINGGKQTLKVKILE